jgi:hypothetical protein
MRQRRRGGRVRCYLRGVRAVPFFAGCLIAAAAGVAVAQPQPVPIGPAPAPPPQPEAPPPQPEAPPQPQQLSPAGEVRNDAAWRLYHDAFGALLQGKRKRATELAAKLRREHAGHPAAAMVASSPLALGGLGEPSGPGGRPRRPVREEPSSSANAELALFQTLHGLTFGVEMCVVLECDEAGAGVGLSLAGGTLGALISLKAVGEITSGQRALLNSGPVWGAFNALMMIIAGDPSQSSTVALGLVGGQTAGLVAGAALFDRRPTAGQVALANSGGQWGATLMGLTLLAASADPTDGEIAMSLLVAADVGVGMGAYLATLRPDISRAQTLVIDAGGIVGGVGGGGLGVLLSGRIRDRTTAAVAALGVAAGLGAAAYFTRDWGDSGGGEVVPSGGAHAILMPAEHGQGGLLGVAGSW